MTTYTIVGYKDNKVDYCRGCYMGSVHSNFDLTVFSNIDEAAQHYAEMEMEDPYQWDRNICHYWELTVLMNGKELEPGKSDTHEFYPLVAKFKKQILQKTEEKEKEKAIQEKQKKEKEKKQKAQKKEENERKEFDRLKKKYEK